MIGAELAVALDDKILCRALDAQVAVVQVQADGRLLEPCLAHPAHIVDPIVLGGHVAEHRPRDFHRHRPGR